jgi:hypothetical protein
VGERNYSRMKTRSKWCLSIPLRGMVLLEIATVNSQTLGSWNKSMMKKKLKRAMRS